jgi:exo-beta-1,3-glucanase (GH17 family)
VNSAYRKVKAKAGSKEVIVETGWPSAGESRWNAVPGSKNATRYLSEFTSWARSNGVRYFYFEAFDEPWKSRTEGSVGGHWGLWDKDGQMKQYARSVLNEGQ